MTTHLPSMSRMGRLQARPKLIMTGFAAALVMLTVACVQTPPEDAPPADQPTVTPEATRMLLEEIMAALATDMEDTAMGLWTEDVQAVAEGAGRIADHPRVPPAQMAAVQAVLGQEFGDFVVLDRRVHDRAVELRDQASAGQAPVALVSIFVQVAEGCVGCHTTFRERVSSALADLPPGGG